MNIIEKLPSSNIIHNKLKKYDEDGGRMAEEVVAKALEKIGKEKGIIEKVEMGTPFEDQREKVDFWIKFTDIDEPVGVQFTITSDFKREQNKINTLPMYAKKEKRDDAEINWSGRTDLVLIKWEKSKMAMVQKKYEEQTKQGRETKIENQIDKRTVLYFLEQLIRNLSPIRRSIISEQLKKIHNKKG